MKYYRIRRYVLLLTLHISGFAGIPNFHKTKLFNNLHKLYVLNLDLILIGAIIFQFTNTFVKAIQDISEFLQRFFETMIVFLYATELWHIRYRLKQIINLFNLQEKIFKNSNNKIYNYFQNEEQLELKITVCSCIFLLISFIFETFIRVPQRTLNLMSSIYERKYPERLLPFIFWTPKFIDPSDIQYYIPIYIFEIYALILLLVAIFCVIALQTLFPTPLVAQYKMLSEFVKLIGENHTTNNNEQIFYVDIARGKYITKSKLLDHK